MGTLAGLHPGLHSIGAAAYFAGPATIYSPQVGGSFRHPGRIDGRQSSHWQCDCSTIGATGGGENSHNFFAGTIDEVDVTLHPHTYTFLAGIGYKFHGNGSLIAQ